MPASASAHGPRRRFAFLVSTTGCIRDLARHMGDADYSYGFVLEQLQPVLEQLGECRRIEHPETTLFSHAQQAAEAGLEPVHLALNPPQVCYFTPGVPTVLFPFWEFPDIPSRSFGFDSRQNWRRLCRHADCILTASHATAAALTQGGVSRPIHTIPVPISPAWFDVEPWHPERSWTIACRHLVIGGEADAGSSAPAIETPPSPAAASTKQRSPWGQSAFRVLRRLIGAPRADGLRDRYLGAARAQPPSGRLRRTIGVLKLLAYEFIRRLYQRYVTRWLSDHAVHKLGELRARVVRHRPELPLLPSTPLTLNGLVYTSVFNLSDRRKNVDDLLSAFLLAFRDRADVTLVLKLATNPTREYHEVQLFQSIYNSLGISHRCRVVVLTDFLDDDQMLGLMGATTYYVNTSRAEGACLPLQNALAAGRPGLAPVHSAMADYMSDDVGFVVASHPEPTYWPHDPRRPLETYWHRLVWSDLHRKFLASATMATADLSAYRHKAVAARARMKAFAARPVVQAALAEALDDLPSYAPQRWDWAA